MGPGHKLALAITLNRIFLKLKCCMILVTTDVITIYKFVQDINLYRSLAPNIDGTYIFSGQMSQVYLLKTGAHRQQRMSHFKDSEVGTALLNDTK